MAHDIKCSYPTCRRVTTIRKGDDFPDYWYCPVHSYCKPPTEVVERPKSATNSAKEQVCDHVHNIQGLFRAISDSASNDCQNFSAEAFLSGEMDVPVCLTIIRSFCDGIEQDLELLKAKYT